MANTVKKVKVPEKKQTQVDALVELMSDNGYHTVHDCADYLNCTIGTVGSIIHIARMKHNDGEDIPWIHSTVDGFTINPSKNEIDQEGIRIWKRSTTTILNFVPVFKDMARRGIGFNTLQIQNKPKMLMLNNILNKKWKKGNPN